MIENVEDVAKKIEKSTHRKKIYDTSKSIYHEGKDNIEKKKIIDTTSA
jgi:hypothetical protein